MWEQSCQLTLALTLLHRWNSLCTIILSKGRIILKTGSVMLKDIGYKALKLITEPAVNGLWVDSIQGLKNIPRDTGAILIANHASYLDFIILGSIVENTVGRPLYFWANSKVCNHPVFKYYAKSFKSIEIDYDKPSNAFWKESIEKLRNNQLICIFPEGTRTRTGRLNEFNSGYLRLAKITNSVIVPIVINGTFKILPPHRKTPALKKCKVIVYEAIQIPTISSKHDLFALNEAIHSKYYRSNLR